MIHFHAYLKDFTMSIDLSDLQILVYFMENEVEQEVWYDVSLQDFWKMPEWPGYQDQDLDLICKGKAEPSFVLSLFNWDLFLKNPVLRNKNKQIVNVLRNTGIKNIVEAYEDPNSSDDFKSMMQEKHILLLKQHSKVFQSELLNYPDLEKLYFKTCFEQLHSYVSDEKLFNACINDAIQYVQNMSSRQMKYDSFLGILNILYSCVNETTTYTRAERVEFTKAIVKIVTLTDKKFHNWLVEKLGYPAFKSTFDSVAILKTSIQMR